ncbi:MAG TPA: undecaprenyl-phosphate glucose phosphotransferase [Polyangiaceae bacterium]|jgi:putative colanic acid biosynthesis UDP-glucose lipid carrier transferase|nr:undecaprenyl-phosphate glucose phosphotransferase [Polyangiaceae bacterium]
MGSGHVRQYSGFFSIGQRIADVLVLCGVRFAAWLFYVGTWSDQDTIVSGVAALCFLVTAEVNGVYRGWRGAPLRQELRVVLWTWLLTIPWVLGFMFAAKIAGEVSRAATGLWFVGGCVGLMVARSLKNTLLGWLRVSGRNSRVAGIIGVTPAAKRLYDELQDPSHGIIVTGIYDSRNEARVQEHLGTLQLVGSIDDALEAARLGKLDLVYIALPFRAESRIAGVVAALADTTATVQLVTDFSGFDLLRARWVSVGTVPTVALFDSPFSGVSGVIKRLEDLVLGTLFLMMASPVMIGVALAIKVTCGGPIFFAQTRYGLNGKAIRVLKFCSMRGKGDDGPNVKQATKDDDRITPIGRFLRSSSLDELPQLFNVILGSMSLVGPRPHAVAHNELFRSLIHGYMLRHKVKPGITGWAQVNGLRGETETIEKMRARVEYDLQYIENWDLRWDLEIILRTVFRVWRDKNAY